MAKPNSINTFGLGVFLLSLFLFMMVTSATKMSADEIFLKMVSLMDVSIHQDGVDGISSAGMG
jgi:hypothetical protein